MASAFCLLLSPALLLGAAAHGGADGGRAARWVRPQAPSGVVGRAVDYAVEGATYEGYLAVSKNRSKVAKAALVAHQYMGLGQYEMARADELAAMGYTAFALDVYGKGVRCDTASCARETMRRALANITKLRALISAGTEQLLRYSPAGAKLVAMGYCFGGSMVLELARHPGRGASQGVTFAAVASFHGTLAAFANETAGRGDIRTDVQVHHAELDFQGDATLEVLKSELKQGTTGTQARWEANYYSKVKHGWTEPGTPAYDARAAVQSHKSAFEFFEMALGLADPAADPFPSLPFCRHEAQTSLRI